MLLVYVALGVLTLAVLVLAAMTGELAARIQRLSPVRTTDPQPLTIPGGEQYGDISWPPDAGPEGRTDLELLVLSTTCTTCATVAERLGADPAMLHSVDICLVTPHHDKAREFLAAAAIEDQDHHYVDEFGTWCRSRTGIDVSPALLAVRNGRVTAGYTFEHYDDLVTLMKVMAGHRAGGTDSPATTERR
jgi:hypothetical protein